MPLHARRPPPLRLLLLGEACKGAERMPQLRSDGFSHGARGQGALGVGKEDGSVPSGRQLVF